jgi:hypothetical protein
MDPDRLILTHPDNQAVFSSMNDVAGTLQNPYIDIFHWTKGEIFDLMALMKAVNERNNCEKAVRELEKKKRDT